MNTDDYIFVPSWIPQGDVEIVVVGEAPGYQEAKAGRPFVGPSGKLLQALLKGNGVDVDDCMLTNTVLCRHKETNASPGKTEMSCCAPRLKGEIDAAECRTIIALGTPAITAIMGRETKITEARLGPPKESPLYPGIPVVPSFHPAYCLRTSDAFPTLHRDIAKAFSTVTVKYEPPVYRVFDDASAVSALRQLGEFDRPVVDIECGFDKDTEDDHPDHYQMLCVGIGYKPGRVAVIGEEALKLPAVQVALGELLRQKKWTAHNGKFDMAGLQKYGVGELEFDTMLSSYCLDERPGVHSLEYRGVEVLGAPNWKHALDKYRTKGGSYAQVPRDVLYDYNAKDVAVTWDLRTHDEAEMDADAVKLHAFLCEASPMLMHAEMRGLKVDMPTLDHLTDSYLESLGELESTLFKWVNNPRSPKQVMEAIVAMGFKPPISPKTKKPTTDADALQELLDRSEAGTDPAIFFSRMLAQRKEQKLYGTYVKGIRKRLHGVQIHPSFRLHGTTTGRLACRNPNLQNVPRGSTIRGIYVADEGSVFIQGDFEQAELRVVLTLADQRGEVFDALSDPGRNVFDELTTELYGEPWVKEQRVRTKAFVHGTNYGRESYSIAKEYGLDPREGDRLQKRWLAKIPKVVAWQAGIRRTILRSSDDMVSPFGRHRRFWLITDQNRKDVVKEALAFLPQGISSDICLAAATSLWRRGLDVRLLVHDSILVQAREEDAEEVGQVMSEVMTQTAREVFTDFIPFPAEISIGKNWGVL